MIILKIQSLKHQPSGSFKKKKERKKKKKSKKTNQLQISHDRKQQRNEGEFLETEKHQSVSYSKPPVFTSTLLQYILSSDFGKIAALYVSLFLKSSL